MKSIPWAAASVLLARTALAAVTCPEGDTPEPVPVPSAQGAKCQAAIAKEASAYAVMRLELLSQCAQEQTPGLCPRSGDMTTLQKAAIKAAEKIAKTCAGRQAGLATSYRNYDDPSLISECTLGQHVATTEILLGNNNGTPGRVVADAARDKCAAELSKQGVAFLDGALAAMNACFKNQTKKLDAGTDVAAICAGSWSPGGAFVAPADKKTAKKLAKLERKVEKGIQKKCALTDPVASIESLFACPGAETVADLQACIVCENRRGAAALFVQQNGESFEGLVDGSTGIQAVVGAAPPGGKIFVRPGTYRESVTLATHGLQLVGCGAALDDRPIIRPPDDLGASPNGVFAASLDGLLFQGLEVAGWAENGIFVTDADFITIRDVVGDGENRSVYAIYPVQSRDVVVEGCVARRIADAGIYVGQDDRIVVRYNRAEDNVAGMEIENSQSAKVYGNFMQHNTGGLLVFKLPGPPLQLSNDHEVFDNVSIDNNTPNFGHPTAAVGLIPDGTGLLVLSTDTTDFHHNIIQGNGTFGIAAIDQRIVNALSPGAFNPESPEQSTSGNVFRDNLVSGNGTNPDTQGSNGIPAEIAGNILYVLGETAPNCFESNVSDTGPITVSGSECTP